MIQFNLVDGSAYVGVQNPAGKWNVKSVNGSSWTGRHHVSGATNVVIDTDGSGNFGANHKCGAMRVISGTSSTSGGIAGSGLS